MRNSLKHSIALITLILALASCTKESVIYQDQEDFVQGTHKTAAAGDDAVDVSTTGAALPSSMPQDGATDDADDDNTSSGNISDDDDDESDDDASVKRAAQNK